MGHLLARHWGFYWTCSVHQGFDEPQARSGFICAPIENSETKLRRHDLSKVERGYGKKNSILLLRCKTDTGQHWISHSGRTYTKRHWWAKTYCGTNYLLFDIEEGRAKRRYPLVRSTCVLSSQRTIQIQARNATHCEDGEPLRYSYQATFWCLWNFELLEA